MTAKNGSNGQGYPHHPAASAYPMMPEEELAIMVADMREHGFDFRYPVYLLDGQVLDGRNRQKAALLAGVEPIYADLPADTDAEQFVERANEHRRHLTPEWLEQRRQERRDRVVRRQQAGESTRKIAAAEDISQTQVMRDLAAAQADSPEPQVNPSGSPGPEGGTVTGLDGKTYPSKPRKKKAEPPTEEGRISAEDLIVPALGGGEDTETLRRKYELALKVNRQLRDKVAWWERHAADWERMYHEQTAELAKERAERRAEQQRTHDDLAEYESWKFNRSLDSIFDLLNKSSLTKLYREFAKEYHPDRGGSTEAMQVVEAVFAALRALKK
jgi:hypothetical protein